MIVGSIYKYAIVVLVVARMIRGRMASLENRERPGSTAYLRIATVLADRVLSGEYGPGSRLPSGAELCKEFQVSPMTLRRAILMLEGQGLLRGMKGRGTYARSMNLTDSMFQLVADAGDWLDESAGIRLLAASIAKADEIVAEVLRVPPGDRVIYLRRLVLKEGIPAMYHREYIVYDPRRPVIESQVQLTSLHAFLDSGRGRCFPRGELALTPVALDAESASALDEPEGALAFCLEHVFQEGDGTPVSWGWFLLRPKLFRLRAQLGPRLA
jgi:DNA-binding GntR family transcriptional regulator